MSSVKIINESISLVDLAYIIKVVRAGVYSREFRELDFLGEGACGIVRGYKEYAIKCSNADGEWMSESESDYQVPDDKLPDGAILNDLQCVPSIPKLYAIIDDSTIIVERVRGMNVSTFTKKMMQGLTDNFVNEDFLNVYKRDLLHIVKAGYFPYDLHGSNVMICEQSGLPKIIDVGCFAKRKNEISEYESNIAIECAYNKMEYRMSGIINEKLNSLAIT